MIRHHRRFICILGERKQFSMAIFFFFSQGKGGGFLFCVKFSLHCNLVVCLSNIFKLRLSIMNICSFCYNIWAVLGFINSNPLILLIEASLNFTVLRHAVSKTCNDRVKNIRLCSLCITILVLVNFTQSYFTVIFNLP